MSIAAVLNESHVNEIASKTGEDGVTVRVLEFKELKGSSDPRIAETLFFAQQAGMTLKMVEITLQDASFLLEPGALYFMKGKLQLSTGLNGGLGRSIMRSLMGAESFFINKVTGTGKIYLEPSFGHFILHEIKEERQEVHADRGIFLAGSAGLDVKAEVVKSLSGALLGGEGLFQTKVTGRGIAVMSSPVPESEISIVKLEDETMQVDGDFALMRTTGVSFNVEKSTKTIFGSVASGEGLLNVYKGRGRVWLAPTQGVYERMAMHGLSAINAGAKSRNTGTSTSAN